MNRGKPVRSLFGQAYVRSKQRLEKAVAHRRFSRARKICIGAGGITNPDWLPTERSSLDVTHRMDFVRYWSPGSRLAFMAEHVWEHLDESERQSANANCFEFLRRKGWLRIAVPDGYFPDPDYVEHVRPGGRGAGADDHKVLFNYKTLIDELAVPGFCVNVLEYWDEFGNFHFHDWSREDGYIRRSSRYDPRNDIGKLIYTSLIVDALKL